MFALVSSYTTFRIRLFCVDRNSAARWSSGISLVPSGSFFLAGWNVLRSAHWSVYWVLSVLPQNAAAFEYFEYAKQLAVDQPSYTSSSLLPKATSGLGLCWSFCHKNCVLFFIVGGNFVSLWAILCFDGWHNHRHFHTTQHRINWSNRAQCYYQTKIFTI